MDGVEVAIDSDGIVPGGLGSQERTSVIWARFVDGLGLEFGRP